MSDENHNLASEPAPASPEPGSPEHRSRTYVPAMSIQDIKLPDFQPRTFSRDRALRQLQESIAKHGVQMPLLVRRLADGTYELIAGSRRLEAAKLAGESTVPVLVLEGDVSDSDAEVLAIMENVDREDLTGWDAAQAVGLHRDRRASRGEDSSISALQEAFGCSSGWLSERLTTYDHLTRSVCAAAGATLEQLNGLNKTALYAIARKEGEAERAQALRSAIQAEQAPPSAADAAPASDRGSSTPTTRELPAFDRKVHQNGVVRIRMEPSRMSREERAFAREEFERLLSDDGKQPA